MTMADYTAPTWDLQFALESLADIATIGSWEAFEGFDAEMVEPVLSEAARFIEDTVAPLNRTGDTVGATWNDDHTVTSAPGFADAYAAYVASGWGAVPFDPAYGGGGFPWSVALALQEMLNSASMAFALCPLLTQGGIDLLSHHGSETQRETWLPKLVSGEWSATMNLTEPDAGSDVGALRTKAERQADGTYRITGQKIFITYGEHDLTDNIVHLVLARTPDAPPGTKGISTFIVPKYLLDDDGHPTIKNDVTCSSIEHKLGIHGSPTCVLQFGDEGGAVGELIGEENRGMSYMFTMMNNARLSVGTQGVAIAERAYQDAVDYSVERKQGRALDAAPGTSSPIIEHADVRRMLMTMRAYIEAMRGVAILDAAAVDAEGNHPTEDGRIAGGERAALLTPITKSWCTDIGCEITSIAVQVHGGMGFVEETGVAQHFRDARINPIYEGTNGIQALDLLGRKLPMRGGEAFADLVADIERTASEAGSIDDLKASADLLSDAVATARRCGELLMSRMSSGEMRDAFAAATPFINLMGHVCGAWALVREATTAAGRIAAGDDDPRLARKIVTTNFYCEQLLPKALSYVPAIEASGDALFAIDDEGFVSA